MSNPRRQDVPLLEWLRDVERRLQRLEQGDKGVRQNSLRIGNMVIEADNENSRLGIRNAKTTNEIKWLPERRETFGWVGTVALGSDNTSPPAQIFNTTTITEIVLEVLTPTTTGDITATLNILTAQHGLRQTFALTIPAGAKRSVTEQAFQVEYGQSMYVELTDDGDGTATNLSMTVRFDG